MFPLERVAWFRPDYSLNSNKKMNTIEFRRKTHYTQKGILPQVLLWNITKTHIQDNLTKEVFGFRSPMSVVLKRNLAELILEWNLLPH
jgi:hypothetical protein